MISKRQQFDSVQSLIIATAGRLFTQRGVDGASLADIAAAAKLAKGTLYYYYPAKDELVADVARTHGDWMGDTLLYWAEGLQRDDDAAEALYDLLTAFFAEPQQRLLHIVLYAHGLAADASLGQLMENMEEKWALMLEVGALKLQSASARLLRARSRAFFSMLLGYMARAEAGEGEIREFIEIFLGK